MTAATVRFPTRRWLTWTAGFLAFPLAGLAGELVGPLDDVRSALLGGAVTGLVVGLGQSLAGRGVVPAVRWTVATTAGMTVGLSAGAAVVGYRTSLPALALMGLITGVVLGAAQALALTSGRRWIWAVTTPPLWALGWTVTTAIGVDVERQYTIFGSAGAVTFSALSGLVLLLLVRAGH